MRRARRRAAPVGPEQAGDAPQLGALLAAVGLGLRHREEDSPIVEVINYLRSAAVAVRGAPARPSRRRRGRPGPATTSARAPRAARRRPGAGARRDRHDVTSRRRRPPRLVVGLHQPARLPVVDDLAPGRSGRRPSRAGRRPSPRRAPSRTARAPRPARWRPTRRRSRPAHRARASRRGRRRARRRALDRVERVLALPLAREAPEQDERGRLGEAPGARANARTSRGTRLTAVKRPTASSTAARERANLVLV